MLGKKENKGPLGPKDTLIIIGNGFDIWQGLDTSYKHFQEYYLSHRDKIMRRLGIKKKVVLDENGRRTFIGDVELIYGDPFEPGELDDDFWSTFESSLDELDSERLNLFFGKDRGSLRKMNKSIKAADKILREAFTGWITSITIDNKEAEYTFGDNCLFINFNYTDTLLKRFKAKKENIYHIHGQATDKKSIIYGHSAHPQLPEYTLYKLGGRFRGLYFIEKILYETDKHVQDNIQLLCMFLAMHGVMPEEIKEVYVLGHSMGISDFGYFDFLTDATRVHTPEEVDYEEGDDFKESDQDIHSIDDLYNRLQYAVNHVGYDIPHENLQEEYKKSIAKKYAEEQEIRNQEFQNKFLKSLGMVADNNKDKIGERAVSRTEDARWHISYKSDRDRQWSETLMKELGYVNYKLYSTIDECLEQFRI